MATNLWVTPTTPITIKISTVDGDARKVKLPLKDLEADIFVDKLRQHLKIGTDQDVIFERFSDSLGGYVKLDKTNREVFKSLQRAAKAKLKLRIKASCPDGSKLQLGSATPTTSTLGSTSLNKQATLEQCFPRAPKADLPTIDPKLLSSHATVPACLGGGPLLLQQKVQSQSETQPAVLPTPVSPLSPVRQGHHPEISKISKISREPASTWVICCNNCDQALTSTHYHCSICDAGDFDLCEACVASGNLCPGKEHWLVKRNVINGRVVSSTTERLAPKLSKVETQPAPAVAQRCRGLHDSKSNRSQPPPVVATPEMPGAFTTDSKQASPIDVPRRTCNSCIESGSEAGFVNCKDCPDFDLCIKCHADGKHGHHPAHTFQPACDEVNLTSYQKLLLEPGRYTVHEAVCNGCDKTICGVRHKCFDCPDFDYCSNCVKGSDLTHPLHRFAAVYEPLPCHSEPASTHKGILCDGVACTSKPYQKFIEGVRYKCVVCQDLDFCASCESTPGKTHDPSHPMLKITTPIRDLSVDIIYDGSEAKVKSCAAGTPCATTPAPNAAGPVKTVVEIAPLHSQPSCFLASSPVKHQSSDQLNAHFVRDSMVDGSEVAPNARLRQTWTLRNPGPAVWPAGCCVRYVGGDNMLDVDSSQASSASVMATAVESNAATKEIWPGDEFDFSVYIRAPARSGKAISYWRLKAPDGTPFGHRLWCHIEVVDPPIAKDQVTDSEKFEIKCKPFVHNAYVGSPAEHAAAYAEYESQLDLLRAMNMERMARTNLSEQSLQSYYTKYQDRMKVLRAAHASSGQESRPKRSLRVPPSTTVDESPKTAEDDKEERHVGSATPKPVSTMTFPTLEHESPVSSTTQLPKLSAPVAIRAPPVVTAKSSEAASMTSTEQATPTDEAFDDLGDELEVMSADGRVSDDDDGFLTDEEYDILDASDQETVAGSV